MQEGLRPGHVGRAAADRRTPAADRDAPPGAVPWRSRSSRSRTATTGWSGSTSPARRPATRPRGTSTRSSTSSARTRTSPSTRARRSACPRSGRRSSGAAPTGSVTASGSSTTSPRRRDEIELGRLAQYVRDKRIPLELCPHSNLQTGAAPSIAEHPIGLLAELRFRVTVNTDNRLMSNTSMSREMAALVDAFGWGLDDLQWVTVNAMKSAFVHFEQRLALINEVIKPGVRRPARAPGRRRPLMPSTVESLFWITLCGVLAPLLAGSVFRRKVPEVVLLLLLGVRGRPERARPRRQHRRRQRAAPARSRDAVPAGRLRDRGPRARRPRWPARAGHLGGLLRRGHRTHRPARGRRRDPRRGGGGDRADLDGTRHVAADPQGQRDARNALR